MPLFYSLVRIAIIIVDNTLFRTKIVHKKRLPKGGFLIAMNHSAYADILHIMGKQPRVVHYLAKKELFKTRIGAWFHYGMQEIPVDRQKGGNVEAVKDAVKKLKKGGIVGIFPEGGTKPVGQRELAEPHTGVSRMALMAKVPIVPAGIAGNRDVWHRLDNKRWIEKQYLIIGKPMYFEEYYGQEEDREVLKKIVNEVMAEIDKLIDEGDKIRGDVVKKKGKGKRIDKHMEKKKGKKGKKKK